MDRAVCLEKGAGLFAQRDHGALQAGAMRLRSSRIKRVLDLSGAGIGILLLAPALMLISLLILVESKGPVFYRQTRTGRDGKVFSIFKFRTMRVSEGAKEIVQAQKNDGRCTRFGKFLRRSSIDELPQLINVLKGEMSLVGPRPHAVKHDEYYGSLISGYTLRFEAVPGITGLAQSFGYRGAIHDLTDMADRIALDHEYITRWSFALDLRILIRTLLFAPFHRAAY